jgi:hypothetical protein
MGLVKTIPSNVPSKTNNSTKKKLAIDQIERNLRANEASAHGDLVRKRIRRRIISRFAFSRSFGHDGRSAWNTI